MANRYLADDEWRRLFDELRVTLREVQALEARVADGSAPEAEWTRAWGELSGLISRLGVLQQRLLARRIALLPD